MSGQDCKEGLKIIERLGILMDSGGNWSKELGYNWRWSVESFFSAYKRTFGESVKGDIF